MLAGWVVVLAALVYLCGLFAVAHAMESDAVARYCETAKLLREEGADDLAAVIDLPELTGPVSRVVVTTEPVHEVHADDRTHGPVGLTGEFQKQ